jgi:hypothetical protein
MKINKDNYEAFFLDYLEGRLNDSSVLEMQSFLRRHPELKGELESFCEIKLPPAQIVFKEKEILKKLNFKGAEVTLRNFDDFCIAYYEKQLSDTESEKLLDFVKHHPDKKRDFQLYGEVFLKVDTSIAFEGKSFLKKKIKVKTGIILLRWTAVAAGIVLAISIFYKSPVKVINPLPENPSVVQNQRPASSKAMRIENQEKEPDIDISDKSSGVISKEEIQINVPEINEPAEEIEIIGNSESELALLQPLGIERLNNSYSESIPDPLISTSPQAYAVNNNRDLELLDLAEKVIKKKVFKSKDENSPKKISLWDIADITLKGYNRIAEKDIILHRRTDENGKLTAIALETENRRYGYDSKN